jgi:hypothetical protein
MKKDITSVVQRMGEKQNTVALVNGGETGMRPAKYPFIRDFVISMSHIKAEEKVTNEMDLKSLLLFTRLYTRVIKHMNDNGIECTIENTERVMTEMYDMEREKYHKQIQKQLKED